MKLNGFCLSTQWPLFGHVCVSGSSLELIYKLHTTKKKLRPQSTTIRKFYDCSAGKEVGADTWINFTSLPQNGVQALHYLN